MVAVTFMGVFRIVRGWSTLSAHVQETGWRSACDGGVDRGC